MESTLSKFLANEVFTGFTGAILSLFFQSDGGLPV